jgi:Spy/CpxP family protein refolding chaperone
MLKHCLLALMLAGLVYAVSPSAIAQNTQSNDQSAPAGGPPEHGRGHFDPARQTEMLTKHLNLTSEQQPKVLEILKSEQSQMQNLRSDTSLSQQDRRAKMMEIRKTSNEQIRALLDSDQQKKWDEMQARHEQWQEHRQNGQGGPPNSSDRQ